ncbi:unnamed protein product [Menidia menidia]|uniref:(Atlantic silverside) hypothetical protein n=1 Tax=Menidia menidia TaxID=238744 RepID=A0A8S4BIX6_9TELE|nr:unnamed protein product [Menidia menidia]
MSVTTGFSYQLPGITTVTYVFVYSPGSVQRDPSPPHHTPPALTGPRGPKRKLYSAVPGRTFIVVKPYTPQGDGEIQLNRGERVKVTDDYLDTDVRILKNTLTLVMNMMKMKILECFALLSIGEGGFWEGTVKGRTGWFPADCVEEVQMRHYDPRLAQAELPTACSSSAARARGDMQEEGSKVKRDNDQDESKLNKNEETREDRNKRLFRHYTVGSYDNFTSYSVLYSYLLYLCSFFNSDYIIEEKNAVLQKKENEGFGFVLRGAKAETPIEEFTPTPAFPALQYLESVDVEGVAWRAGLRTGDFLIEVNGVNVVKVGHKQVVSLIRQGGNRLLMKVVSVTRKPESEEVVRKKVGSSTEGYPCSTEIIKPQIQKTH